MVSVILVIILAILAWWLLWILSENIYYLWYMRHWAASLAPRHQLEKSCKKYMLQIKTIAKRVYMIINDFFPKWFTDLPFEAESAPNPKFQNFLEDVTSRLFSKSILSGVKFPEKNSTVSWFKKHFEGSVYASLKVDLLG